MLISELIDAMLDSREGFAEFSSGGAANFGGQFIGFVFWFN